jgi:hypothetical protein
VHFWVFVSRAVISSYSLGSNILVLSVAAVQGLRHILVRCSIDCLAKFVYHTRLVIKVEGASVVQENAELIGKAAVKDIGESSHLLLHDPVDILLNLLLIISRGL